MKFNIFALIPILICLILFSRLIGLSNKCNNVVKVFECGEMKFEDFGDSCFVTVKDEDAIKIPCSDKIKVIKKSC